MGDSLVVRVMGWSGFTAASAYDKHREQGEIGNRSRPFPRCQHGREIDLQSVIGQPGTIGKRLAHLLRLGLAVRITVKW